MGLSQFTFGQSNSFLLPADFVDVASASQSFSCGDCSYTLQATFQRACNGSGRVVFGVVPDLLTCTVDGLEIDVTNTDLLLEQYTGSASQVGYNIGGKVTSGETFSVNASFLNNSGSLCSSGPKTFTVHALQGVHIIKTIACNEEALIDDFLTSINNSTPASDYPVILGSNLNVNVSYTNIGRDWHIIPGVGIRQSSGTDLLFQNSVLDVTSPDPDAAGCDRMWNGITAPELTGSCKILNTEINHAAIGVYSLSGTKDPVDVELVGSTFYQNYIGLLAEYNRANHTLIANTFSAPDLISIEECTFVYLADAVDYLNLCGRGYAGVVAKGLKNPFLVTASNNFETIGNGYLLTDTEGEISNQSFADVHGECFAGYRGGYAINAAFYDKTFQELDLFSNEFYDVDYGVKYQDERNTSTANIINNDGRMLYRGVDCVLEGAVEQANVTVEECDFSELQPHVAEGGTPIGMAYTLKDSGFPSTFEVRANTVEVDFPEAIGILVFEDTPVNGNNTGIIESNEISIDEVGCVGIQFKDVELLNLQDNFIEDYGSGNIGIWGTSGSFNTVCSNWAIMSPTSDVGIYVQNEPSLSLTGNDAANGVYGIHLEGDCYTSSVAENTLLGTPSIGIYHSDPMAGPGGAYTTDDQYGKANDFSGISSAEVTIIGDERYIGPQNLWGSPTNNWEFASADGATACGVRNGDELGGEPPLGEGVKDKLSGNGESVPGRDQIKSIHLYDTYYGKEVSDTDLIAFLSEEDKKLPGVRRRIKGILGQNCITSSELDELKHYSDLGDDDNVSSILATVEQCQLANRQAALTELATLANEALNTADEAWINAMEAILKDELPTESNLATWKQLGETCYAELGEAVYLYAGLYMSATGNSISTSCEDELQERSATPSVQHGVSVNHDAYLFPTQGTHFSVRGLSDNGTLDVISLAGQVMLSRKQVVENQLIDCSQLPVGTYFVKVKDGEVSTSLKFLRQ